MMAPNGTQMVSYYDLCARENITNEMVESYAAKACKELGETLGKKYCLQKATEKCIIRPY